MSDTRKPLTYSRALLELTVRENGEAMATITRVFSEFARLFAEIEQRSRALQERFPQDAQLVSLVDDCTGAGRVLRDGLRAVQIHDITDQRLAHIATLLDALAEGRECEISSLLTDEEERALLQLIERGVPGHEVFGHLGNEDAVRGSVELF
jgi:hypothetical protein